jgi:hypothetical protein
MNMFLVSGEQSIRSPKLIWSSLNPKRETLARQFLNWQFYHLLTINCNNSLYRKENLDKHGSCEVQVSSQKYPSAPPKPTTTASDAFFPRRKTTKSPTTLHLAIPATIVKK